MSKSSVYWLNYPNTHGNHSVAVKSSDIIVEGPSSVHCAGKQNLKLFTRCPLSDIFIVFLKYFWNHVQHLSKNSTIIVQNMHSKIFLIIRTGQLWMSWFFEIKHCRILFFLSEKIHDACTDGFQMYAHEVILYEVNKRRTHQSASQKDRIVQYHSAWKFLIFLYVQIW